MPKLTKYTRKLNEEQMVWVVQQMACDKSGSEVAAMIKKEWDIDITPTRLYMIRDLERYSDVYNTVRTAYRQKLADFADVEIYAKRTRIQDAEKLRKKIGTLIEKVERKIGVDLDSDKELSVGTQNYMVALLRELRGFMGMHLKTLEYAQNEAKPINKEIEKQKQPSLKKFAEDVIDVGTEENEKKEPKSKGEPSQEGQGSEVDGGRIQEDNPGDI